MQTQDTSRIGHTVHNTSLSKRTNRAPTFKQTQHDIFGSSSSNNQQHIKTGIRTYATTTTTTTTNKTAIQTQRDPTIITYLISQQCLHIVMIWIIK